MNQIIKVHASAGSGKTYQLARRYVELLLSGDFYNDAVLTRGIIAITFTKKATVEMKSRILLFLKKIALDDFSNEYERKDLLAIGQGDVPGLRERAHVVIAYILDHYDFFKVQTIDSLVREMLTSSIFKADRSTGFRIAEDYRTYLDFGVDSLLEQSIESSSIKKLFARFLQNYIYVKEDPAWVPKKDIITYIETLFRLTNQYGCAFKASSVDSAAVPQIKGKIKAILDVFFDARIEGTNKTFLKTLDRLVSQKKITAEAFKKTFQKEYYPVTKGHTVPDAIQAQWSALQSLILDLCEAEAHSLYDPYISIYNEVYKNFEESAKKNDVVFLEELNTRIKRLLADESFSIPELCCRVAPFARHFLIDEFQDTNFLNWQNLDPLISESLASGGTLFYVGDKKQAIYQFRGGDARLFDLVPTLLPHSTVEERMLDTNYRSHAEIVNFINVLFSTENVLRCIHEIDENEKDEGLNLLPAEYLQIVATFDDVHQKSRPDSTHGYVSIQTVPGKVSDACDEAIMSDLVTVISEARVRGFSFSDIAILTRSNAELEKITAQLLEEGVPIVSEKTLNIRGNRFINEFLSFLRFLESPIDNMSFALFVHGDIFQRVTGIAAERIETFLFDSRFRVRKEANTYFYMLFRTEFPEEWKEYIEPFFKKVGIMPLYEFVRGMCETLRIFETVPESHAFFMRLLELVKEEESDHPSISGFLTFFDGLQDADKKLYVPFADTGDSLQLLTYHKAKGLEFPIVIIPFLSISIKTDKQVCYHDEKDSTGEMRLLHLLKSYAAWSPALGERYREVLIQAIMTEFNILYVALTRPICELYCFVPERINGRRVNRAKYFFSEETIEWGIQRERSKYSTSEKDEFYQVSMLMPSRYRFWMNKLSEKFTDVRQIMNRKRILRGKVLHHMLSFVGNIAKVSLDEVLAEAEVKTRLVFPHVTEMQEYSDAIRTLVEAQNLKCVFDVSDGEVFTEKDIVTSSGQIKRLDRLIVKETEVTVIDYKSAQYGVLGDETEISVDNPYRSQVLEYMSILSELYPKRTIKGYLLYMNSQTLEEL